MINHIIEFIESLKDGQIELYNEYGLQHELGYFLRQKKIKVKFEYNINLLDIDVPIPLKKEMDLFFEENKKKYLIELKFPTKGAFPLNMTQSIKDIFFIQQLIDTGLINKGYFLFFTKQPQYLDGYDSDKIYSYFRKGKLINKFSITDIQKFLHKKEKKFCQIIRSQKIKFKKKLKIEFNVFKIQQGDFFYFIIEI